MIPDYQTLMRPVLRHAANGPIRISTVVENISEEFQLSLEERELLLPSGKQTTIANRTHWARTYLKQAGLVRNTQRGWFELTARGREVLADESFELNAAYLERFEEFRKFKRRSSADSADTATASEGAATSTPDENLAAAHARLNASLATTLIDLICEAAPTFFERLIVDLLLAMGYGGTWEEAGRAIGQAGDDGIDGVVDQDPLGVDQVYLQAKRYKPGNVVGAGAIRDFFGALSLKRATKGIFFTTSSFSVSAQETAKNLGSRIVLIDGEQLANLMIRYNVGVRDKQVLHIKRIDEGYFEE